MASDSPKTMSNRLMTMKFMQRSAARSVASSPSTPNERSAKRMRLSNGTAVPGTSSPGTSNHEILQSAVVASEKERHHKLSKTAGSVDEAHWILSFKDPLKGRRAGMLNVRQTGYAEVDVDDDNLEDSEEEVKPMRMKFGGGVKKIEDPATKTEDESDDGSESSFEGERDERPAKESRAVHVDSEDTPRYISTTSRAPARSDRDQKPPVCYSCGRVGHMKQYCPKTVRSGGISSGGR